MVSGIWVMVGWLAGGFFWMVVVGGLYLGCCKRDALFHNSVTVWAEFNWHIVKSSDMRL